MARLLLRASGVVLCSSFILSVAHAGTYAPTKDTYFRNTGSAATNDTQTLGSATSNRGAKDINTAFYLSDFDRAAITAEVRSISGNLSNPLTLGDMATVQLHWMIKMNLSAEGESVAQNQGLLDARYSVTDLQTDTPNWTEAGSTNNWVNWTGTAGTSTRWQNLAGVDLTSNDANGDINSAFHQRFDQSDPLTAWGGTAPGDGSDLPQRDWILSNALALDYLTNPNVAGLALIGDTSNPTNMEVWSREGALADQPSLVVTAAVPEPASIGLLALGGVMLLRRRRRV